jgi:hypothetical protein
MRRLLGLLAVVVVALGPASDAAADWVLDALGGVEWDDNVNRAARARDRETDTALIGSLSSGYYFQLTDSASLLATADLRGTLYTGFEGLSSLAPGASARLRDKFGLGPRAPWAELLGSAAYQDYRDAIRSGVVVTAGARAGQRLHDRFALFVGYAFDLTDARDAVFSASGHTASVRATVTLTRALELGLEYAVRVGDIVVTRSLRDPPPPSPSVVIDTFDVPLPASRIPATTYAMSVDLSYALTDHIAATVGFTHRNAQAARFAYPDNALRGLVTYTR